MPKFTLVQSMYEYQNYKSFNFNGNKGQTKQHLKYENTHTLVYDVSSILFGKMLILRLKCTQ
jgi:hypothetical protein